MGGSHPQSSARVLPKKKKTEPYHYYLLDLFAAWFLYSAATTVLAIYIYFSWQNYQILLWSGEWLEMWSIISLQKWKWPSLIAPTSRFIMATSFSRLLSLINLKSRSMVVIWDLFSPWYVRRVSFLRCMRVRVNIYIYTMISFILNIYIPPLIINCRWWQTQMFQDLVIHTWGSTCTGIYLSSSNFVHLIYIYI